MEVRDERDCLLVARTRFGEMAFLAVNHAELVVRNRMAGVELERALEARLRLVEITGAAVRDAEIDVRRGRRRHALYDFQQRRDPLLVLLLLELAHGIVVLRARVGIDLHIVGQRETGFADLRPGNIGAFGDSGLFRHRRRSRARDERQRPHGRKDRETGVLQPGRFIECQHWELLR